MAVKQQQQAEEQSVASPKLSAEVRAILEAPLDPAFLRERKGDGGRMYTYADLDYLESRASQVDPDWQNPAFAPLAHGLSCTICILGVPRSATAGYYVGATYEVWDGYQKEMVQKPMTSRVAHTIVTAAQAAAERRAFAKFGLGAELWAHHERDYEEDRGTPSGAKAQAGGRQRNFRAPTEKRIELLVGMGVPSLVAQRINSWSSGKDEQGNPISDVGNVINALFKARGRDKGPVDRRVWEEVIALHAPYALNTGNQDDDDADEWAS